MPKFDILAERSDTISEVIEAESLQDALRKFSKCYPADKFTPIEIFDQNSDADYSIMGRCRKCGDYMIDYYSSDINLDPCCQKCGGSVE